jgi:Raf kinase inhibitor-like YbhB/YbcL family protein
MRRFTMPKLTFVVAAAALSLIVAQPFPAAAQSKQRLIRLEVSSPAFREGEMIPKRYTCQGKDISPPLKIAPLAKESASLVLIMDDPDAPRGTWVHWVLFNLPSDTREIPEAIPTRPLLPNGAVHGANSWGNRRIGYGGPCPPSGTHRYYFKVYALDTKLKLKSGATIAQVEKAMKGHVMAEGQLMGKYRR